MFLLKNYQSMSLLDFYSIVFFQNVNLVIEINPFRYEDYICLNLRIYFFK